MSQVQIPFLKTPYNYDRDKESELTGLLCEEETLTQQQFKDEVDINTIVERFGLTGELPDEYKAPQSGDFTGVQSFEEAMLAVRKAEESFMEMPAAMRARFNNDPQTLINFLEDSENRNEALKLGLIQKPPEKTRDMVDAVDELRAHFVAEKAKP